MKNPDFLSNRVIRVFISSTFQDMQDERNELMKKTFPILQRKAAERDVTLTELDLRWGITPQESKSGKVVDICLREIENSYPFFIGIIGNRYGWIPAPKDLERSTCERFSQVSRYLERRLSVTEMEMQFGVLERAEDMHAYFFIKEPIIPDEEEPEKLVALRTAVRANGRYPVSVYHSREDLAQQVEAAFTKLLDKLFPEGALSELEKERLGQRAYLNSLCQNYIRTKANFDTINAWMSDWEAHQLVITGASGLGKSALVANWIKDHLSAEDSLPYRIIYHFVGNGGSLGSHGHVIKALCDEIRDRYGFDYQEKDVQTDEKALEALINRVAAEGDKPLLIVLDAINQIIDTDNAKQLNWLPIPPKNVKILFTTLTNDRTMEVFKNRRYPVFTLRPLTKRQRNKMVRGYLGIYSKKLQPYQIDRIVSDGQCRNTLALKTLLDELINFGIFEKLDKKIDSFLGTTSIEEFYGILLNGYEKDFGKQFVKHVLSLIAVSRNGLSEEEILSITDERPLHWSQFYCAFHQHLITKNGLISFAHTFIRNAVETRYLQGHPRLERTYRKEIVAQLQKDEQSTRAMGEIPFQYYKLDDISSLHYYLLGIDVFEYLNNNEKTALGKYWYRLINKRYSPGEYLVSERNGDRINRVPFLLSLSTFSVYTVVDPQLSLRSAKKALDCTVVDNEKGDVYDALGHAYSVLGKFNQALEYRELGLTFLLKNFGEKHLDVATSYNNIGLTYNELGNYHKALEYAEKALQIRQALLKEHSQEVAQSYSLIGFAFGRLGDARKALEFEKKALGIRLHIYGEEHPDVAHSYNNVGGWYGEIGDYPNALKYKEKSLLIRQAIYGEKHPYIADSLNNVAAAYSDLGDHKKGLAYDMKALRVYRSVFGCNHPRIALSFNNIGTEYGEFGNHRKALEYKKKALTIRRRIYGDSHPDVASSFDNVGKTYMALADYQKALDYVKKGLDIRLSVFGANNPVVAASYNSLGLIYEKLGEYRTSLDFHEKALVIDRNVLGDNHPDVAKSLKFLGKNYKELRDYKKALESQEEALSIYQRIYDRQHPTIAGLLNDIGHSYGHLGNYKKAIQYEKEGLKAYLITFGNNHPAVAISYSNIGIAYDALGEHKKAIDNEERALSILRTIYGDNHPEVAISYNNLGCTYLNLGNCEKALENHFCSLNIRRTLLGEHHPDYAVSCDNIGWVYEKLGDLKKSLEYRIKALDIYRDVLGDNHKSVASLADRIGSILFYLGDHLRSIKYFNEALCAYRNIYGDNHPSIARTLNNIGCSYRELGNHKKALQYMEHALRIFLNIFGEDHPSVAISYNNIGASYGDLGDIDSDLQYRMKALDIARRTGIKTSEAIFLNKIAHVFLSANQVEAANDYFRQAAEKYRELGDEEQAQANLREIQ